MLGLCCHVGFSLVVVSKGYPLVLFGLLTALSSLVVRGLQGTWASVVATPRLQSTGSVSLWRTSLVASWPVGSSQIRDGTQVSCIGRRILYH